MTTDSPQFTAQQLLAIPMQENSAGAETIGQYLFSALKPPSFNPSTGLLGADPAIVRALVTAGAIQGSFVYGKFLSGVHESEVKDAMSAMFGFLANADYSSLQLPKEPEDWYVVYLDIGPNISPVLMDYFDDGMTEAEARRLAKETNDDAGDTRWIAVQIPK